MYLTDSHCHPNFNGLADRLPEVFANTRAQQARQALAISVNRESFAEVFAIAENNGHIFCTIGVHPDRRDAAEFSVTEMVAQARHPKVAGIGETGLDYYRCKGGLAWQHRRFADHIQAVNEVGLPAVVHICDTAADTLRLLKECNMRVGVTHCFSEGAAFAEVALDLGLYISFLGIVTFKNMPLIQETMKYVPADRMLVETDSPFLTPVSKRDKPNEPSYVRCAAEFLVKLRGETLEQVAGMITRNFYRLFSKVPRVAWCGPNRSIVCRKAV